MASADQLTSFTGPVATVKATDGASRSPSPAATDDDLVSYVFDRGHLVDGAEQIFINAKDDTEFVTYNDASRLVKELAAGLLDQGLAKGDTVCIHSYNDIRYPLIWLGVVAAGGIVTGSNPAYTPSEIVHHFRTTNTRFIIAQSSTLPAVFQATRECSIRQENIFLLDAAQSSEHLSLKSWTTLLSQAGHPGADDKDAGSDRITPTSNVVCYAATSGTTGLPKAAKLTHRYFIEQLKVIEKFFTGRAERVVQLHYLPIFHAFAAPLALLLPLRLGIPTYLLPRFRQDEFVDVVDRYQITDTAAVPPIVASLTLLPFEGRIRLRSLRFMLCAGAPLSASVHKSFCKEYHPTLVFSQCWGCTETGWISVFDPAEKDMTCSIGRLLPNTLLKVLGEDGQPVHEDGVHGEAYIKSSHMFAGYVRHDGLATSADMLDADGYYATGDIVYVKQGKLYIAGRSKDIMKVNGWQVSPEELQNVIMELQHRGIQDCAVVGNLTIDSSGLDITMPRAYVVKAPDATITAIDVKIHVKRRLISYKQLSGGVVFVDRIPRNATGKILRHVLQKSDSARAAEHSAAMLEFDRPTGNTILLHGFIFMLPLVCPLLFPLMIIILAAALAPKSASSEDTADTLSET